MWSPGARASLGLTAALCCAASGCDALLGMDGLKDRPVMDATTWQEASSLDGTAVTDATDASLSDGGGDSPGGDGGDAEPADASYVDAPAEVGGDTTADAAPEGGPPVIDAGSGVVALLRTPCSTPAGVACAGNAQKVTLICSGSPLTWNVAVICGPGELCDSRPGLAHGTCAPIDPLCASLSPGIATCSDSTHVITCGPDLVSHTELACSSTVDAQGSSTPFCVGASCVECRPNTAQCLSTTQPETCSEGKWQHLAACQNQTCVGGTCAGVCVSGQTRCGASNDPAYCGTNGQWVDVAAPCVRPTPYCVSGACNATPASCTSSGDGLSNCGAAIESCCASLPIGGGTYYRTYATDADGGATGEADPATVSDFSLDKYLVTVGRYRQFLAALSAGYTPFSGSGRHWYLNGGGLVDTGPAADGGTASIEWGWDPAYNAWLSAVVDNSGKVAPTWTPTPGSQEKLPINYVNFYQAYAFCIWDGGFLPSEAEWEYAAVGWWQDPYPWGSTDPGWSNVYAIDDCYYPSGMSTCSGVSNIAPVGTATLGAGGWGQLDLLGEMQQWTLDLYAQYANPCNDGAWLTAGVDRVFRGRGFNTRILEDDGAVRHSNAPTSTFENLGFRCARAPQ